MSNTEDESNILKRSNKIDSLNMIFTVPNIISFIRIILIIPFVLFFLAEEYIHAFACVFFSGISDCLDGFLARKLNQVTDLGKILDPIADKLTLVAVIICLGILVPTIFPLLVTLVTKDVLMLAGGYYLLRKRITPPPAKWYGKVSTIIFYIAVVTIVFCKAFLTRNLPILTAILLILTAVSMMFSLVMYARIFFNLLKKQKNSN